MKRGKVYIKDIFCGIITESEEGYTFEYDKAYLNMDGATALSPTMPLTDETYVKEMMFPVLHGLIPEGWLLDIAQSSWKIDARDRMSLLLACCKDCIGDIGVIELKDNE